MALIINETVTLTCSGLTIDNFAVVARPFSGMVESPEKVKIIPQAHCYINAAKAFEDLSAFLKVEGFPKSFGFTYRYGVDIENLFYWIDLQLKAKLLEVYPTWQESNIIVTTEPTA